MKKFSLTINNKDFQVEIKHRSEEIVAVEVNQQLYEITLTRPTPSAPTASTTTSSSTHHPRPSTTQNAPQATNEEIQIPSPIPGLIVEIPCKEGDQVTQGQTLLKIEAMKMENQIKSPKPGTITQILVTQGQEVKTKQVLMRLKVEG